MKFMIKITWIDETVCYAGVGIKETTQEPARASHFGIFEAYNRLEIWKNHPYVKIASLIIQMTEIDQIIDELVLL